MAKVSISKAAHLAGISRSALYEHYINPGRISVERNAAGKPEIDVSELLRVFGSIQTDTQDGQKKQRLTPLGDTAGQVLEGESGQLRAEVDKLQALLSLQEKQVRDRERQIQEGQERESWLRKQVEELTSTMKLLEDNRAPVAKPRRRWWLFGRRTEG